MWNDLLTERYDILCLLLFIVKTNIVPDLHGHTA